MKVKLLVSRSGSDGAFAPGDEIDVSDAEAKRMIEAGQCEPVRGKKAETTAKKAGGEKTAKAASKQ